MRVGAAIFAALAVAAFVWGTNLYTGVILFGLSAVLAFGRNT